MARSDQVTPGKWEKSHRQRPWGFLLARFVVFPGDARQPKTGLRGGGLGPETSNTGPTRWRFPGEKVSPRKRSGFRFSHHCDFPPPYGSFLPPGERARAREVTCLMILWFRQIELCP